MMDGSVALTFGVLLFVSLLSFSAVVYAASIEKVETTEKQRAALCRTLENHELEAGGLIWTENGWFSGELGRTIPTTKGAVDMGFARPCGGVEVS